MSNLTCTGSPDSLFCSLLFHRYSFGVLVFEMYAEGRGFFGDENLETLRELVVSGERPDLPTMCPLMPGNVGEVVSRCWAQDVDARPSFMHAAGEARYHGTRVYKYIVFSVPVTAHYMHDIPLQLILHHTV